MSIASTDVGASPSRLRLRPLSFVVLLVVAAIAVAGFVVTRQVAHDQEHRLIKQRAEEAGLYLQGALSGLQGMFSSIAADTALKHNSADAFNARALPLTQAKTGGYRTVALLHTSPVAVATSVGQPLTDVPSTVSATVASALVAADKAGPTGALFATPLFNGTAGARRIGFVYATPQFPGYAVYAESEVHPDRPTPVTAGQPFSELVVALYAVPRVDAAQLVVATGTHLPLRGQVASAQVAVGVGPKWLLVAKARHPLVGSVASATPWALLAAGLLAAVLATAVVETLSRRREYALAVADARTRELKTSLEDLAAAHEQLVRQERLAAIGELASTIGHELRNPLGVISNALYLLRGDVAKAPSEAASRHLSTAEREVSAATVIVSDLLEFARQRDPVMTENDLGLVVDEALGVLPPPTGITVDRPRSARPVTAVVDRDMLRQVVLNLVGNAYQAMPEGGTVTVGVEEVDGGAQLQVSDTGAGMTSDVRAKVFEPFFTTKTRGVGLGLAVSKRIVDAHDGTITVDSEPGRGSAFTLTLPRVRVPRQSARVDLPSEPSGAVQ